MIQAKPGSATQAPPEGRKIEVRSLEDVFRSLVGQTAIISHPESMKSVPLGYQLKPSFNEARIHKVLEGMVVVVVEPDEDERPGKGISMKQYIPMPWIKLVCVSKGEIHLHI